MVSATSLFFGKNWQKSYNQLWSNMAPYIYIILDLCITGKHLVTSCQFFLLFIFMDACEFQINNIKLNN